MNYFAFACEINQPNPIECLGNLLDYEESYISRLRRNFKGYIDFFDKSKVRPISPILLYPLMGVIHLDTETEEALSIVADRITGIRAGIQRKPLIGYAVCHRAIEDLIPDPSNIV